MKNKQELKINIGGSSIILIIVVFALAVFAVLSMKASNSDLGLAKKTRAAMNQYYKGDTVAEEYLAELDKILQTAKNTDTIKSALEKFSWEPTLESQSDMLGTISYEIVLNEYATLQVALTYDLKQTEGSFYDVITWKVNQESLGEYDFNNFQFWDGTIEEE